MQYKGKLYGKVNGELPKNMVPLEMHSDDVDAQTEKIDKAVAEIEKLQSILERLKKSPIDANRVNADLTKLKTILKGG